MSQSQILRRVCDNPDCQRTVDVDLTKTTPDQIQEIQKWYSIARESFDGQELKPMIKQACCSACIIPVYKLIDELFEVLRKGREKVELAQRQHFKPGSVKDSN